MTTTGGADGLHVHLTNQMPKKGQPLFCGFQAADLLIQLTRAAILGPETVSYRLDSYEKVESQSQKVTFLNLYQVEIRIKLRC